MAKPHEQEWYWSDGVGPGVRERGTLRRVFREEVTTTAEDIALALSGPDMARALLAFLPENGHTLECGNVTGDDARCSDECRNGRAALRKAGVL